MLFHFLLGEITFSKRKQMFGISEDAGKFACRKSRVDIKKGMKLRVRQLAVFLFCIMSPLAKGGDGFYGGRDESRREKASVYMLLENDVFSGHDENYTNGFSMGYISETEDKNDLGFISRTLGTLNGGGSSSGFWHDLMGVSSNQIEHQWGINVTQLMFTPQSLESIRTPIYNEHPYGAWLAFGFTSIIKNEDRANTLTLYLGAVGEDALGRQIQDIVHDVMDSPKWAGWDNQLPSEFTMMLSFERKYRLRFLESDRGNWGSDGYTSWLADVGNVYIRGGGSLYFRYGYKLPASCHPSEKKFRQRESYCYCSAPNRPERNWSMYAFGGLRGYAIAYDVFLDGNMFHNAPVTVGRYPMVIDFFGGACLRYKNMDMIFGYTIRSKEYPSQRAPQWMGTMSLRYCF